MAGYDIVSEDGYESTMIQIEATVGFDAVRVWHCNDAKAPRGSKLDRHQHVGKGTIGKEAFRRLLNDPRSHTAPSSPKPPWTRTATKPAMYAR